MNDEQYDRLLHNVHFYGSAILTVATIAAAHIVIAVWMLVLV